MASIVVRERKDGSKSYQVRWREDGRWDSRTVHDLEQAEDLKFILERTGSNIVETERLLAERFEDGPTLTELMHDHIRHLTNVGPYMLMFGEPFYDPSDVAEALLAAGYRKVEAA